MSTLTPALPSSVPSWFFYLGTDSAWERMSAACSSLEGTFYASLRAGSATGIRAVQWIQNTSYAHVDKIQTLFNGANALLVLFYAHKLVNEIQGTFQFSVIDFGAAWTLGTLPVMAVAGTAFVAGVLLLNQLQKTPTPQMSVNQKAAKALHVTKLVLNVALACFVKNRFWFAVSLAGSVYSLVSDCKYPITEKTPSSNKQWNCDQFETLHAQYSVVRAGIGYLQQHPELALTIEKISSLIGTIDFLWLAGTCYYLYQKAEAKILERWRISQDKQELLPFAGILTSIALFVLSYLAVDQLNARLHSDALLKDLAAKLSPSIAQTSSIRWVSFELTQTISMARLAASTALAFFSKQRMTNLVNVAAQACNLAWISRLSWIEWKHTISSPMYNIPAAGGTCSQLPKDWQWESLDLHTTFIIDPSCASDPNHLQSSLQAISTHVNSLFAQSKWELYLENHRIKGFLKSISLPVCGCTRPPVFVDFSWSAKAQQFWYRSQFYEHWWNYHMSVEIEPKRGLL